MSQIILIDADIITYGVAFSVETPIYVCKGGVYRRKGFAEYMSAQNGYPITKRVNVGSEQELRRNLNKKLAGIFDDCGSRNYEMYLTASKVQNNFRSKIATIMPYKGNRLRMIKPVHYNRIREILVKEYGAILVEGQEADDMLAIRQTELHGKHGDYEHSMIASIDKDLLTVPGYNYNFNSRKITFIEEDKALKNFYKQLLIGDATDNIPGLAKLLSLNNRQEEYDGLVHHGYIKKYDELTLDFTPEQCYNHILGMYEGYGYGDKELLEIGSLLWLRRFEGQMWGEGKV